MTAGRDAPGRKVSASAAESAASENEEPPVFEDAIPKLKNKIEIES